MWDPFQIQEYKQKVMHWKKRWRINYGPEKRLPLNNETKLCVSQRFQSLLFWGSGDCGKGGRIVCKLKSLNKTFSFFKKVAIFKTCFLILGERRAGRLKLLKGWGQFWQFFKKADICLRVEDFHPWKKAKKCRPNRSIYICY